MKIAIIDKLGLCYDGNTLSQQGLGGSESAVILIANELSKIGFSVTVYNNCKDGSNSKPGIYDGVRYIDNSDAKVDKTNYDIVIVSRTVAPFVSQDWPFLHSAKKRILWLHDTFIEGDQIMEDLAVAGKIDHIFTLSDWHTSYILTCAHGKKRNYEVLKKKIFQTRNGAVCHIPEVDLRKKDPNHFVYNASATKGMIPLVDHIWPEIKKKLPKAKLTIIGGYYRFREGAKPDEQENTVAKLAQRQDLKNLDVTFTGVIPQNEIAKILANAWMMLYPGAFPETFGISSLESLLYKTPLMTTRFGALEETAVDLACYHIDYAIEPNSLFPHINKETQIQKFLQSFFAAYSTPYLHQQNQNYCDVVKDVAGWNTVALQWKQFFYSIMGEFLSADEYREVTRINDKVSRVFGRTSIMPSPKIYRSYNEQKRIVVISPFWNAENYIEKHIHSVAAQDYDNYIHILIDDCSDDNSYEIAKNTILNLLPKIQEKFKLSKTDYNQGCIKNQLAAYAAFGKKDDIIMLLDGDDWLINNNTIFHYYNDLYNQGYEFTYGSMWSIADNIPLIAQEYPSEVKKNKTYRSHHFNWKIPYTHLRTCLGKHFHELEYAKFKNDNGEWMKSGADNPLFYELIEQVDSNKIYCNREVVCNYNDANPLNDYKIRGEEQNRNANKSYKNISSFESLIQGKTVAVIGNAKSLLNQKLGDEIDKHDIVIRFNRALQYPINKITHGSKTDIWVVWQAKEYENIKPICEVQKTVQAAYFLGCENKNIEVAPGKVYDDLMSKLGKDPSSGLVILEWLSRLNPKSVSVYGFDWKETPSIHEKHTSNYMDTLHDFEKEKIIAENYNFKIMDRNMKTILVAIPTNKYIEVETFKSIWDLYVPEGYKLDFQFFYGYSRSQVLNLACEWGRRYDASLFIERNVILAKDAMIKCLETNKDVVSLNDSTSLFIRNTVINGLEYPHFEESGSDLQEKHVFNHKAMTKGFSYVNLDGLVRKIEKKIV
jgi:glycosyltransferase involved in cell wall biosynthesis